MKGRVACEMGNQNELMMTEIIFNNILSDSPPNEVAALLSCMVFEAKNVPEPKLPQDSRLKQVQLRKSISIRSIVCVLTTIFLLLSTESGRYKSISSLYRGSSAGLWCQFFRGCICGAVQIWTCRGRP